MRVARCEGELGLGLGWRPTRGVKGLYMCGICGFVEQEGRRPDRAVLERMNQRLIHRGPDDDGQWLSGGAAIAMRRLAIIDLQSGHQPMFNEDGKIGIVFNGEIYNYPELRQELESAGHRFASHSDTETIVHLYEQHGADGIERLNGMFALALWDSREQSLLLARDRAGKKPLYYAAKPQGIVFSSELASLLEHPNISREIDLAALDSYFCFGYVPAPRSIFRGVRQLEPGTLLVWKRGGISTRRYWRLNPRPLPPASEQDIADQLFVLLKDAVRVRLHSDVPFGALLSGGIDSSLVVGLMSQLMDRRVKTFTIGFPDKHLDESADAEAVARYFDTDHYKLVVEPRSVVELLPKLVTHFGEPFADASAIPTYLVSELARQHVTMALSGDGGDEVFGGYRSYRYHYLIDQYRRVPGPIRTALRLAAGRQNGSPGTIGHRVRRFLREAELPVQQRWQHSRSIFSGAELQRLYSPNVAAAIEPKSRASHLRDSFQHFADGGTAEAEILNHVDYETYLPGDILVKVDRLSMANSLEVRSPLLDYRLAEFAAGLPARWKWTATGGKQILKKALERLLPNATLRRPKQGFVLPVDSWFRGELSSFVREVICSSSAGHIVQLDYAQELLKAHQERQGGGTDRKLWAVLCYLLWHDRFNP